MSKDQDMLNKKPLKINISTLTILKFILILATIYFLYFIKDILVVLFISLVLASAFDPLVGWIHEKMKLPRAIGMILIYFVVFAFLSGVVLLIVPPIARQISELSINFPSYLEKATSGFSAIKDYTVRHGISNNVTNGLGALSSGFQGAAGGIFSKVSGIFGGIISFFLVLAITFYMVAEDNAMKKIIWSIVPNKHQPYTIQLMRRMQRKIGLWMRGQIILSFIIFILTFLVLSILGVDYALTLALIAGFTEFVPYLGPILAAIPAVFLAFMQSPMLAIFVLAVYYIIQFVENNIIVPKLMQKVVGLNPIISIAVLLIGFKMAGIIGAILSIPVATAMSVFAKDLLERRIAENNK